MKKQIGHDADVSKISHDLPTEISDEDARGGAISGRVLTVLLTSLGLALIAMIVVLAYYYSNLTHWFGAGPS